MKVSSNFQKKIVDGKVLSRRKVQVYTFDLGGFIDDPELEASDNLYNWRISPAGQFVFSRCQPVYHYYMDQSQYTYKFVIIAELEEKDITEFSLRFGTHTKEEL